jgi:hypothetical protein
MGIEPTSEAWEASILPLYDARSDTYVSKGRERPQAGGFWLCAAEIEEKRAGPRPATT